MNPWILLLILSIPTLNANTQREKEFQEYTAIKEKICWKHVVGNVGTPFYYRNGSVRETLIFDCEKKGIPVVIEYLSQWPLAVREVERYDEVQKSTLIFPNKTTAILIMSGSKAQNDHFIRSLRRFLLDKKISPYNFSLYNPFNNKIIDLSLPPPLRIK